MRASTLVTRIAWVLAFVALVPATARAQAVRTDLTVTGFPITLAAPTGSDYLSGSIVSSPVTFTVDATNGPAMTSRTAAVSIRCSLPCPTSGTKTLASLQWRRGDLGTWNQITTSDVLVEQRSMVINLSNDPWANTILFRLTMKGKDQEAVRFMTAKKKYRDGVALSEACRVMATSSTCRA